jgi:sugar phosphate permease
MRPLWGVLSLLVVSVSINYIDRGNLSIAAPLLKDELGISAGRLGLLLSAFFWTYALLQVVSGWLADRLDVNWIMAAGFVLWSGATAATGLVRGFAAGEAPSRSSTRRPTPPPPSSRPCAGTTST